MMNQQMNVPLKDMDVVKCEACEHEVFNQSFMLRKVSRFVTGQTADSIVTIPLFACAKCGYVNKEFLPPAKAE